MEAECFSDITVDFYCIKAHYIPNGIFQGDKIPAEKGMSG
jgi:hypothetical protein